MHNILDHSIIFSEPRLIAISAWLEHTPFAMLLMDLVRPKIFVELGTATGVSYCAFCQAAAKLGIDSSCFAVDTWRGDEHAGFYGQELLDDLRRHHDQYYTGFSTLIQSTFDEAVQQFADGSIDLLHIDGLHTYDAVKHDFETWRPKLSDRAVVIFHDTNEYDGDFGVWKLWAELKTQYPHFEFLHEHGLGILGYGSNIPQETQPLFSAAPKDVETYRFLFHGLGKNISSAYRITRLEGQLNSVQDRFTALETLVNQLEQMRVELYHQVTELERVSVVLENKLAEEQQRIFEKDEHIKAQAQQLAEIQNSRSWRLMKTMQQLRLRVIPTGGRLERFVKTIFKA